MTRVLLGALNRSEVPLLALQPDRTTQEQILLFHIEEAVKGPLFFLAPAPFLQGPTLASFPVIPSPSFPTVKMVCEMLLRDAEVFKWLLVSGFKGPFPGPDMEELAGGV